jgi:hypothetical protein
MKSQLQMDIIEMTLSNLKEREKPLQLKKGNDTVSLRIYKEGEINSPYLKSKIRIKNISDSNINLYPNLSSLYILYNYEGSSYSKKMRFKIDNNKTPLKIKPNEELFLDCWGYLIGEGTALELKFLKMKDYTLPLIKILPTLKFRYEDKYGIKIDNQSIINVEIEEKSSEYEEYIPSDYEIIEE